MADEPVTRKEPYEGFLSVIGYTSREFEGGQWVREEVHVRLAEAYDSLADRYMELQEQLDAAQERLARYEEPGWINSVQAVVEARQRAARCEEQFEALRQSLDEVLGWGRFDDPDMEAQRARDRAYALLEELSNPASSPVTNDPVGDS